MQYSRTRSVLRVSAVVLALMLVFDGGYLSPLTRQLSDTTITYLASAGASMSARVAENEYNAISAQLAEGQRMLAAREQELAEREIAARDFGDDAPDYSTYIISLLLFIIIVLLLLNYVMDWQRARTYYRNEHVTN